MAITDRNRLIFQSGFGWADPATRVRFTPQTPMPVGSIGKSFTALVLTRLAARGRIDLDEPVRRYLPWFGVRSRPGPITVRHLMNHAAGIPEGTDFAPSGAVFNGLALSGVRAAWPAGSRFHYSNTGYKILGYLIERVTRRPLREVYEREVLKPFGMRNSRGAVDDRARAVVAQGFIERWDDRPPGRDRATIPAPWLEYYGGDGSIVSSAVDLCAYARPFLRREQVVDTTGSVPCWEACRYAAGWILSNDDGHSCIGHGGMHVGYSTNLYADLDEGLAVAILSNGPWGWLSGFELAVHVVRSLRSASAGRRPPTAPRPAVPTIAGPTRTSRIPPRWAAIVGTYRAHNPWNPVLRVIVRGGRPVLASGAGGPVSMWSDGRLQYRVGESKVTPETISFDSLVDGRAQRASRSGSPYFRVPDRQSNPAGL